jgi:hypothetical protein
VSEVPQEITILQAGNVSEALVFTKRERMIKKILLLKYRLRPYCIHKSFPMLGFYQFPHALESLSPVDRGGCNHEIGIQGYPDGSSDHRDPDLPGAPSRI